MRRPILLAGLLVPLFSHAVAADNWALRMFQTTSHDFGTIARGAKEEFRFELKNLYKEDVHIAGVRSSCGCTMPRAETPWLKTHQTGAIITRINTQAFLGQRGATVTVTFDKPYFAQVQLQVKCYIRSDVVFNPGSAVLGSVDEGTAAEKKITIHYAGRNDWQILKVTSGNPHLSGEATQTRRGYGRAAYDLIVRLDPEAPPGYIRDHLVLVTNDRRLKQVPVPVEAVVNPSITVSPGSLFMGVVHPGEKVIKQIVVRGKMPFRVVAVNCEGDQFHVDCAIPEQSKTIHLIPVSFVAGQTSGKVSDTIRIQTDLGTPTPQVTASAVVSP